jgi:hypothetical protein
MPSSGAAEWYSKFLLTVDHLVPTIFRLPMGYFNQPALVSFCSFQSRAKDEWQNIRQNIVEHEVDSGYG